MDFSTFFVFQVETTQGIGLSCASSSFLLWSLGFGFSLFPFVCGGILLLQSISLRFLPLL